MFSIIACIDSKRGIGKNGTLPWSIKEDMDWFKKTTIGDGVNENVVIMGRKTWESIPEKYRPLKDRFNIVVSKVSKNDCELGKLVEKGMGNALSLADTYRMVQPKSDVFVIGGSMLYNEAITYQECEELILTILDEDYDCDTFFPEFENEWECVWSEPMKTVAGRFTKWKRK